MAYHGFLPPGARPLPVEPACHWCGEPVGSPTADICPVCWRRGKFARWLIEHGHLSEFSRDVVVLREH